LEGLLGTLGNVKSYFKDSSPSDFEVNVGAPTPTPPVPETNNKQSSIPTELYWIGGAVLVLGVGGMIWGAMKNNKAHVAPTVQVTPPIAS